MRPLRLDDVDDVDGLDGLSGIEAGPPLHPSVEAVYDAAVRRALAPVSAAVALLLGGLAAVEVIVLSGQERLILAPLGATLALLLASVCLVARRGRLDDSAAHPLMLAVIVAPVAHAVVAMCLTRSPNPTVLVLLAAVGAGSALLSLRWVAATLYLTWGAWAVGAVYLGSTSQWPWASASLAVATVLALAINRVQRGLVQRVADLEDRALAASVRDPLSGLANRRGLAMVGAHILETARRQGDAVHAIFLNIDNLNRVNDRLGHAAGDEVICAIAAALHSVTRATDVAARWGGDQFCVVGPGPGMAALELERRLRDLVLADPPVPDATWSPYVSAGGAMLAPWDAGTLDTLLGRADQEMYLRRSLRREGHPSSPHTASAEEAG